MIKSYSHGNEIIFLDGEWRYPDTLEISYKNYRPCSKCGRLPTPEGYDGCLGYIPGVREACCGHGVESGYISFINRKSFCTKCHSNNYNVVIKDSKYKIISGLSCCYLHPEQGCMINEYIFK